MRERAKRHFLHPSQRRTPGADNRRMYFSSLLSRLSSARPGLRAKLLFLSALVAASLVWLSVQGWRASHSQERAQAQQVKLAEARCS
ncbi:MAG: hypothetical protein JNJ89_08735 [Rubrivivax sp.]|nr:hypothetical protein [Rubrivivax sp.]